MYGFAFGAPIWSFLLGASVGSFLNVVVDRLPAGRSLVSPGSFCEACEQPLRPVDLVPIFSYLWLRGRCGSCGAAIPARLAAVEMTAGLLFVVIYLGYGFGREFVVVGAATGFLLAVAMIDLERQLILNRLTYPAIAVLLVLAPFWPDLGFPRTFISNAGLWASLANSLVAGGGAYLLFFLITLVSPQGMGGGDVKLAGLLGLLLGLPGIVIALWTGVVVGGLVAAVLMLTRLKGRKDAIPFGPFLVFGGLLVLLAGGELGTQYQEVADWIASFGR